MNKLNKIIGYAVWGVVGGYFGLVLFAIILGGSLEFDDFIFLIKYPIILIPIIGGVIGGGITKKWWGATIGGCFFH